jgi:hypothetical protein
MWEKQVNWENHNQFTLEMYQANMEKMWWNLVKIKLELFNLNFFFLNFRWQDIINDRRLYWQLTKRLCRAPLPKLIPVTSKLFKTKKKRNSFGQKINFSTLDRRTLRQRPHDPVKDNTCNASKKVKSWYQDHLLKSCANFNESDL